MEYRKVLNLLFSYVRLINLTRTKSELMCNLDFHKTLLFYKGLLHNMVGRLSLGPKKLCSVTILGLLHLLM